MPSKEGKNFEGITIKELRDSGEDIATQVTLVPLNGNGNIKGNRIRTDAIVRNKDGGFTIIETKRSSTTRLSEGQKAAMDQILNNNKMFEVRSNIKEFGYKRGQIIKIDEWKRINKYN